MFILSYLGKENIRNPNISVKERLMWMYPREHLITITLYMYIYILLYLYIHQCGQGSWVGIANDYGLDGPGSNPYGGRDFPPVQTGPWAHPASCKMGTGSFLGVKCGRGVLLAIHSLLVPRSWKSRAIPLPTLRATPGLERDHFTF